VGRGEQDAVRLAGDGGELALWVVIVVPRVPCWNECCSGAHLRAV
jgi:hypothetical protein